MRERGDPGYGSYVLSERIVGPKHAKRAEGSRIQENYFRSMACRVELSCRLYTMIRHKVSRTQTDESL